MVGVEKGDGACKLLAYLVSLGRTQSLEADRMKGQPEERGDEALMLAVRARDSERILDHGDIWVARLAHLAEALEKV
jgi:hypothetical protein